MVNKLYIFFSASPREVNGFEKVSNTDVCNGNTDYCKVCAQNIKFINGKHRYLLFFYGFF